MCERLEELISGLRDFVGALDASRLRADKAMRLVELFSDVERLGAAGRTLAAGRVAQTGAWRASGAASATEWVAARAGSTLTHAAATLQTAHHLRELPAVREAFVAGRLSEVQAAEITAAASADPSAERDLLSLAERESFAALRERCRDVRAAAAGDEDATERIRRGRYLRHWTDRDGALRLDARLAPDDGAPLVAVLMERADKLRDEARHAGQWESSESYVADALVSLVDHRGAAKAVVHVHVSASALERGHTVAGETCRIEGVGPITVSAARRLAAGGIVKILQTDGVDVQRVAHAGRAIPAVLRTALETRDRTCVVPNCNRRRDLEIDHIVPYGQGGTTTLENLARLCRWHHAQKTHHRWRLSGGPGHWIWRRGGVPEKDRGP